MAPSADEDKSDFQLASILQIQTDEKFRNPREVFEKPYGTLISKEEHLLRNILQI